MSARGEAAACSTLHRQPLVRRILAPNPSAYTYTGTQTYLVGDREVAVIDPGPDLEDHVARIVRAIDGATLRAIVCTHTHVDHSPAAASLSRRTGAPIIGCAALSAATLGPRADAAFDSSYRPDSVLRDGDLLRGDSWTLQAVHTPGHTSNHLCIALIEAKALFTGDHVLGWSTTVVAPPDGNMAEYRASLARLMTRDDAVYYPAHGYPVEAPKDYVSRLIEHRQKREVQILGLIGDAALSVPEMVRALYEGLDPGLIGAACLSVTAHLFELEKRGLIWCDDSCWQRVAA